MIWEIRQGDALTRLKEMSAGSVQTCITSPPYFGLRDYGTGEWEGGDEGCDHVKDRTAGSLNAGFNERWGNAPGQKKQEERVNFYGDNCGKCGARRVDQQVGLEQTPDEYVARLVEVFREVHRVLRDDGTLWLNLGDSYAGNPQTRPDGGEHNWGLHGRVPTSRVRDTRPRLENVKVKDLIGIPWMVAFALRADGWYLRSDIVWNKPNPMPESVTDRPTKSHEYLFLLAKSPKYFWDADAVRESDSGQDHEHRNVLDGQPSLEPSNGVRSAHGGLRTVEGRNGSGRNKRSVWTVATQPFPGAHFAVFPPKLIEPCVLAGSALKACGQCGAPWVRVVEATGADNNRNREDVGDWIKHKGGNADGKRSLSGATYKHQRRGTDQFEPSCSHTDDSGQSVVLDPFAGAGTTGLVALQHGRSFIGIELNPGYVEMASQRIATAERLGFRAPEKGPEPMAGQTSIFDGEAA